MVKYGSVTKTERNEALAQYTKEHPELSLKEIGKVFGISIARVWQIQHHYGYSSYSEQTRQRRKGVRQRNKERY